MKRTLVRILILALALALTACSGGGSLVQTEEEETATAAATTAETAGAGVHDVTGFSAGFGRQDITPDSPVPLGGYVKSEYRISRNVLDPIYVTCVALRDEAGETLLILQFDLSGIQRAFGEQVFYLLEKETGVPRDHVLLNGTHTHSAPDVSSEDPVITRWKSMTYQATVRAAKDALADLDACTAVYAGTTETDRLNFVRRYYAEDGFVTANYDSRTNGGEITGYETPVDAEMRIVQFVRENQPDVLLTNWQCHNLRTGGSTKYDLSSDFIGVFQKKAEEELGFKMLYLQGGAGNVNPNSRIDGDTRFSSHRDIGKALCDQLAAGLRDNMKEVAAGSIRVKTDTLTAVCTHADEDKLPLCQEIAVVWNANDRESAYALCKEYGISSPYEAKAVVSRATRGESEEISLFCCAFGDVGLAAAPFEMFCQTYVDLRARSPFAMTLTCGYSNDSQGYMPAAECFANLGYEVVTCKFVAGTAEQIEAKQLEMLNELAARARASR